MKYKFVLDENVFKHALNRVDKYDKPDDSAMNLIEQIADNCHRIIIDRKLNRAFLEVLEKTREISEIEKQKIDDRFLSALKKIIKTKSHCTLPPT